MDRALALSKRIDAVATEQLDSLTRAFRALGWPPMLQAIVLRSLARKALVAAAEADERKDGAS